MNVLMRWTVACWIVLCVAFGASAHADDPLAKPKDAVARDYLQQGNKLYHVREFEKAIDAYKAGSLREEAPVFLYNLGQCYRQLGKYEDAIWHYERFLAKAQPTGDLKTAVEGFIKDMKAELEKKAMTKPPVEPAPEPKPQPTSPPPSPPPPPPKPVEHVDPWYADGIGWALTGAGVVAVGVSGYLLVNAKNLDDQANSEPRQAERNQLHDKASSRRTFGVITGIGGVGLLAAGVVKLVLHRQPEHESTTTSWNVGFTGNGVQVFGSF